MLDFLTVSIKSTKKGYAEIYPKFRIMKSKDLMIRGGDFYAIWDEEKRKWSTDEQDAIRLIDDELLRYYEDHKSSFESAVRVLYLWDAESGMIDIWHKYCQRQLRDNFVPLDETLIFSNMEPKKTDYSSKHLSYPLESGECPAYSRLMSVLYSEEERHKIEWSIGSIVSGDSKELQKFVVLYGAAGTGKSTILNIIQRLFDGYYSVFDAKALGSSNQSFALEAFKGNPLVAIQHDGDLSRIEDNTRLNSLVAHEYMTVNEKFKSQYTAKFKAFLFIGTNKPVKITDAKSGLIRRLIDVKPTGDILGPKEYRTIMKRIDFELGAIASHCLDVYLSSKNQYDDYIPTEMLGATNDFFDFISDSYFVLAREKSVTLKSAWEMYRTYCADANVAYPMARRAFKEELKNYFRSYEERASLDDGTRVRSYYEDFLVDKFDSSGRKKKEKNEAKTLKLEHDISILDDILKDCPAQYANEQGVPIQKWDYVKTKLSDIDTSLLHYVKPPSNHIVIDFDIRGSDGKKNKKKNIEEASKWPPTYAEFSKSGEGIHLHYIYDGDVSQLSRVYDENIEIKIFTGNSSLRRQVTKCNNLDIAHINSGLPLKGGDKVNFEVVKNEKALRTLIKKNLQKEIHPNTKPSIDFIYKLLEDAYSSGMTYDVTNLRNSVLIFAAKSTNQSDYCLRLVNRMHFKSANESENDVSGAAPIAFYDVEVFPNLFIVCWKIPGKDNPVVRMINPSPEEIEDILRMRLIGFNNRRYDNHILYARLLGYSNEELYHLSQRIVSGDQNAYFREAYNISYTDVYDFSSVKQRLKKFEIELGINHLELGLPWDQPVDQELWLKVAEYCDNDVIATEAVFNARSDDWLARQILADVAGLSVNDTTNRLTTKIIFGDDTNPQSQFNYRNMGEVPDNHITWDHDEFTMFDEQNHAIFPGYKYEAGKSTYRGEEVGEGGYVYSEPGMYSNVALLDIASMHPHSIVAENLFGDVYTARFKEILDARLAIKHGDFQQAKTMLNGKLAKYLEDETSAKGLASALKIAINSVYGLTAARFDNAFKDIRNKDNIVAKRGALFMVNLKHRIQDLGYSVVHIKTDSIKIPNATPEVVEYVKKYGEMYGYFFEHEETYEKMCLVNDAVYIAKTKDGKWTATGTQFAVPYVFKTLFSHEPIKFEDLCETKAVSKAALYLDMNEFLTQIVGLEEEIEYRTKKGKVRNNEFKDISLEDLIEMEKRQHRYVFIGGIGCFCPMKRGAGGGILVRGDNGVYHAATGTKGYRWMEAPMVKEFHLEDKIDVNYYKKQVDQAVADISKLGDFEWFIS